MAAWVGLVLIPVVYSVLFFAGPLVRMVGVKLENRRRAGRNVRRVLLGLVYDRGLRGASVTAPEAHDFVAKRLPDQVVPRADVDGALRELAAEFEADVTPREDGELEYTFSSVRAQFTASESVRRTLRLDERELGDIVFDTGDTGEEAGEREGRLFDRALSGEDANLSGYLPSLDRVDFEDDHEIVAFDEELARGGRTTR